jgi:hypothetical protein
MATRRNVSDRLGFSSFNSELVLDVSPFDQHIPTTGATRWRHGRQRPGPLIHRIWQPKKISTDESLNAKAVW